MADARVPNLADIRARDPRLAEALLYLQNCHNNQGMQTNAAPNGVNPPPQAHQAISVIGGAGIYDIQLTDKSDMYRDKTNFVEYSDTQRFENAHVIDLGVSRNHRTALGPGPFWFRSYTAHSTTERSPMLYHATPVSASGAVAPAMQQGQGSGTSQNAGAGFGTAYNTPVPPKR